MMNATGSVVEGTRLDSHTEENQVMPKAAAGIPFTIKTSLIAVLMKH